MTLCLVAPFCYQVLLAVGGVGSPLAVGISMVTTTWLLILGKQMFADEHTRGCNVLTEVPFCTVILAKTSNCNSKRRLPGLLQGLCPCWVVCQVCWGFRGTSLLLLQQHRKRPGQNSGVFCHGL